MQNILNREIINRNLSITDIDSNVNYSELMTQINQVKHQLIQWGFSGGDECVLSALSCSAKTLAFYFAMFELDIPIHIPSEKQFHLIVANDEHIKCLERTDNYYREYMRQNNDTPFKKIIHDHDDKIFQGQITKRDLFPTGPYKGSGLELMVDRHYIGEVDNQQERDNPQPWQPSPQSVVFSGYKSGSGFGDCVHETDNIVTNLKRDNVIFEVSHEEVLDKVRSTPLNLKDKVVGVSKSHFHHNALLRHILPAIIQSGRLVDMSIPEVDGFFDFVMLPNDKKVTKEMVWNFTVRRSAKLMRRDRVDNFMAPSDKTLFLFLDFYNTTIGDFDKPIECVIQNEPTQDHLYWESKMNIKFVYDGDDFQYGMTSVKS